MESGKSLRVVVVAGVGAGSRRIFTSNYNLARAVIMARGRKKEPTALKILKGAFDKNPQDQNKREPKPPLGAPDKPRHMTRLAKAEWGRITKELKTLGVLSTVERGAVEQYCMAYGEWREACRRLDSEGRYWETERGVVENPAGKSMRALSLICHKYLVEFGLTPSSRTRLEVGKEARTDDDEKRFFG